ncbi:MAG: type I-D CRISPR-associated protein Cas10d/Csc3 [Pseudanabaenaceae cyanobacterium]
MTLLQSLLLKSVGEEEIVLRQFIDKVLPCVEQKFRDVLALGGTYIYHREKLQKKYGSKKSPQEIEEIARSYSNRPEQSLLFHVVNGLMIAWNLSKYLDEPLTEVEQRLLCLAMILHDYGKFLYDLEVEEQITAATVDRIINICRQLGEELHFGDFWSDWHFYLTDIAYLAQNTQAKVGANLVGSNWQKVAKFGSDDRRLDNPLRHLLSFGDVAVHLTNPGEILTDTIGTRLNERLQYLGIDRRLSYHRLRDSRGIITNIIHNQVISYLRNKGYEPIIFLADGVVYLTPLENSNVDMTEIKCRIWQAIERTLSEKFSKGQIGFVRDGKGLKCAPFVKELLSSKALLECLPQVVELKVANVEKPATEKRLQKMPTFEKNELEQYADIRADRVAEFIIFAQREVFKNNSQFTKVVLDFLGLSNQFKEEDTQIERGGVNYGWYWVAAHYVRQNATLDNQQMCARLADLARRLVELCQQESRATEYTRQEFDQYLDSYLEVRGSLVLNKIFLQELTNYIRSKAEKNKLLCSLSSAEFVGVEQLDTVVLFKPQQYSNKNPLGGSRLKRGICRIWALEMILRRSNWANDVNRLKDGKLVFLYIYPAYTYSPQLTKVVRVLVSEFRRIDFKKVREHWIDSRHQIDAIAKGIQIAEDGQNDSKYSEKELPFLAIIPLATKSDTLSGSWVEPILLSLSLPLFLGVKVVASFSPIPLYNSDRELQEYVSIDGGSVFANLLGYGSNLSLPSLENALKALLTIYALHMENRSTRKGSVWDGIVKTVKECITDVLYVFSIAKEGLRKSQRETHSKEEVNRILDYADMLSIIGGQSMQEKLRATSLVAEKMFAFYRVKPSDSGHTLLLPFNKFLDLILSVPDTWDDEELLNQGVGLLVKAMDRQQIFRRPVLCDTEIDWEERKWQEEERIQEFVQVCITEVFRKMCQGDRALLQEHRNRLRDGVEFAYKRLLYSQKQSANLAE